MGVPRENARPADPAVSSNPEIPGFQITAELRSGGRGSIYKASEGKRILAVRVLRRGISIDKAALARFSKSAPDRIRHPNLAMIEAFGETTDGCAYYAIPFLRGDPLERLISELKLGASDQPSLSPLSVGPNGEIHPSLPRHAAELFAEAAEGLALAHREGIVHRRLSPQNLFLTPAGRLLITDFGGDATTEGGADLAYRAPEQLDPYPEGIGPQADVHALGAILYEVLTRRPPHEAENPRALKEKIREGRFTKPRTLEPDIPAELEACVLKAMSPRPEERYADAGELAADLRRFLAHEEPVACAPPVLERSPSALRLSTRKLLPWFAAGTLVLVVITAGIWVAAGPWPRGGSAGTTALKEGAVLLRNVSPSLAPSEGARRVSSAGVDAGRAEARRIPIDHGSPEETPAVAMALLTRIRFEIERRMRPPIDALLAMRHVHAADPDLRDLAIETLALGGESRPLLNLLLAGEGEPPAPIDSRAFAVLHDALERIRDEDATALLCRWDLETFEVLDEAPARTTVLVRPNLQVKLEGASPRDFTTRWIRTRARLDPSSLLEAVPRLLARDEVLGELVQGLATVGGAEARDALVRLARERYLVVGSAPLRALAELGAHASLIDISRSDLPLSVREAALRALGETFSGLCLAELRGLSLTCPEPSLRRIAFDFLSAFDEPEALSILPGALDDRPLRDAALRWLERLEDRAAAPVFLEILGHGEHDLRSLAITRLSAAKGVDLVKPLTARLLTKRRETREAAYAVLLRRNELARIPEAVAHIFRGPETSFPLETAILIEGIISVLRECPAWLLRALDGGQASPFSPNLAPRLKRIFTRALRAQAAAK
ncbi:MAG TPA: protein kinase [Planctomycetota bacterium]|nr:protein kinase [Planctomycetota bacterium]